MVCAAVTKRIQQKLNSLERINDVHILLAVESGSRAWGFPSSDSDYDVRFLYVRPLDHYLSIEPRRDVIESPIEDNLDISGWDLQKALRLLLKANPALNEWLASPIRYRWDATVADRLRSLAVRSPFRRAAQHHYLNLVRSQYLRYISNRETVKLKKYFYVLRPALALRWLRTRDDPPPMDLAALRAGIVLEPEVSATVDDLIARKAETSEIGTGLRIALLDRLSETEFDTALATAPAPSANDPTLLEDANSLFRDVVLHQGRSSPNQ